ncbi:unnamed protein product [Polarella glacialis]|uniref:3-oxoacyl-[acyl-carrier-protein] synthase I, chloroplastic n=1 Tax=Polarella glacialis TaxID=89957 RepID=A0A813FJB5_POLGL|nr:unnamed protein product [Polarella glacialis]
MEMLPRSPLPTAFVALSPFSTHRVVPSKAASAASGPAAASSPSKASSSFGLAAAGAAAGVFASAGSFARRRQRGVTTARRAGVSSKWTKDEDRIVITGMGLASVFGQDYEHFHEQLCAGKSGIKKVEGFDTEGWSTTFAGQIMDYDCGEYIPAKQARRLDPFLKYALVSGQQALADAGIKIGSDAFNKLDRSMCGVVVGSGMGGIDTIQQNAAALEKGGPKKISPFFIPYGITNMGSGMLAIETGFMSVNYSISTACATANFCMISAANDIRSGESDLVLAGGVEAPVNKLGLAGFIACRAMSNRNESPETASRPWDKERDGFVLGEGAGTFVMERLSHAKARGARILAEYLGGGRTCDAHHMTEPRGDGLGVSTCIQKALKNAGVDPKQVSYVNAHATSTPAGDITEVRAIKRAFNNDTDHLVVNGTKSMVGHGLGAAGGLEGVALIQAIRHKKVHPTINTSKLDEEMTIKAPLEKDGAMDVDIEVGISNSFGFGGHNAVIALAPYKE